LSAHIHGSVGQSKVQIEGPLGIGLGIKPRGRHVAFAAGTGILVFIDLVAHLILRLTGFNFPAAGAGKIGETPTPGAQATN